MYDLVNFDLKGLGKRTSGEWQLRTEGTFVRGQRRAGETTWNIIES